LKAATFIIFSSDDWGWKTSKYQIATRLAKDYSVLFVSSVGFRAPRASSGDATRMLKKLLGFFRGVQSVEPGLHVLTPLIVPFKWRGLGTINNMLLKMQVAWACYRLQIKEAYLLVFSQNWYSLVSGIRRKKLVYYCVDDHSSFAGIDSEAFMEKDRALTQEADLIFCSSWQLFEKKARINKSSHYMPHGVNYELFSKAVSDHSLTVPPDARGLTKPVLGFFGHISYDWVNVDLLKYLAAQRPEWTILLLGRNSMRVEEFADFPNIVYLGEKRYDDLPAYCKALDVALIPFVRSELTLNCNPLKLYEYLAAGLPVVSTAIPEVFKYKDLVHVADDREQFLGYCDLVINQSSPETYLSNSRKMEDFSWSNRIETICQLVFA
jgi:glycosyltransferase involved in cell wall biosynthesis